MSAVEHWPLFGLTVRTPRVELRYPDDAAVAEIASRSGTDGIHDPAFMPFGFEWTDVAPTRAGCAGVDGCKAGWVVATRAGVRVVERIADVFAVGHTVVGIDMPVGLPSSEPRAADLAARRFLSPRGSTVFPTPPRVCLAARDYGEACAMSVAATGKKLTLQTWNILAKMREVDEAVDPGDEQRVIEVHPECSFAVMNADQPLPSKKSREGLGQRAALLEAEFGHLPDRLAGAGRDDILDAYAALWTAERFARGQHREMPTGDRQRDSRGLLMRIVA